MHTCLGCRRTRAPPLTYTRRSSALVQAVKFRTLPPQRLPLR
jgi:hypothetical protein